jgi:hypothetical protein
MRITYLVCSIVLIAATLPAVPVRAQFQQPNPDELKMTSDPKAPGADAVYLDIEENANDPIHYRSYYERIKVLSEKGKSLATIELPYLKGSEKITDIKGRTIHPDGTIVPLTVKPEDLLGEKNGTIQIQRKVFTLPSVEVGSILEYRYEVHYDEDEFSSPTWQVQRTYFVHKAHYSFTPFKEFMPNGTPGTETSIHLVDERGREAHSLTWWYRLPAGDAIKTSVNGSYSVDLTDIPPTPDEEWMPPFNAVLYRVAFYYSFAYNSTDFWMNEGKLWSKDVDRFAEPSKAIHAAVESLIAPNDSDLDKARKLYAAVQALDNTDYSRKKGESELKVLKIKEARHAEDTWAQKSGDSEDLAMLYLAMLRAAGLTCFAVKVVDRDKGIFDPTYMSLDQLDTTVVVLSTGGKQIVLDPGEKMCPFATVNWRHSYASGIGQSAQGLSIATTPEQAYKDNATSRIGDLNVDAQGGISGQIRIVMSGQEALHWRQVGLRFDDDEVKKQFDHGLEGLVPDGVEAHVDHFLNLNDSATDLMAVVNVKGSLGTTTAKRLLLPGLFFETRGHVPFVNEQKRLEPVDMHYGDRVADQITYHFPPSMTVEGAPQDVSIAWAGHAAFVIKSKVDSNEITIADSIASAVTLAKPEEYQDLRGFYQKVAAADREQLVLTTVAAGPVTAAGKVN